MSNNTSNFIQGNSTTRLIYGHEEAIVQAVFLGIIVVFGVAGNLYICNVVYKNKNLRNPTFVFLANLAVANIGALTLCTPFPILNSIRRRFALEQYWCVINGFLNNFFFCISIFTLSLIATQNYFTIVKPPTCGRLQISQKRAKFHLLGLWIICFVFSFLSLGPFESWTYVVFNPTTAHCGLAFPKTNSDKLKLTFLALVAFIIPVFGMSFAYLRIYCKVRSHEERVNRNSKQRKISTAVTRKLAVTLCLMFGTFVICWLPFFLLITLAVALNDASQLPWFLGRIAYWSGYLNCAINPSLYCLRSSAFKDVIRRPSSTTGEIIIKKLTAPHKRQRAISLPVITTNFKRPKRCERQSYPQIGHDRDTIEDLRGRNIEAEVARLRAYSCSNYEIKDNSEMNGKYQVNSALNQGNKISIGEVTFVSRHSELDFGQLHNRECIQDLNTSITSLGNSLARQSKEIGTEQCIKREDRRHISSI